MFVALTVLAVWLGYNVHFVRQRHAFIAALPAPFAAGALTELPPGLGTDRLAWQAELTATAILMDRRPHFGATTGIPVVPYKTAEPRSTTVPWIQRMLGDQPYLCVAYFPGPSFERACALFPEAFVMVAKEPWPWPTIVATKVSDGWRYSDSDNPFAQGRNN
jgi:hypothetical protein